MKSSGRPAFIHSDSFSRFIRKNKRNSRIQRWSKRALGWRMLRKLDCQLRRCWRGILIKSTRYTTVVIVGQF